MNYDLWRILPQDLEPGPPNPEDLCPVCEKLDCECPPDYSTEPLRPGTPFPQNRETEPMDKYGYPLDWPKCPNCGLPALDGHVTCGNVECNEGGQR